jgi:oligoendopeptidase F
MSTATSAVDNSRNVDTAVAEVAWDLDPLLSAATVDEWLDTAAGLVEKLEGYRGRIADLDADGLLAAMVDSAKLADALGRVGNYVGLRFSVDTADPAVAAEMMKVEERSTELATRLVFFDLEWAAVPEEAAERLLADPRLDFCAHHLRSIRRYRQHLLSEPEEKLLTEKSVSGAAAWVRLFEEQTSAIRLHLPGELAPLAGADETGEVGLEAGLALLQHPDRNVRQQAQQVVTDGLASGLRTRAFIFNTLLLDKSTDDRLRSYPSWISARNLSNETDDASVSALVEAVVGRYDLPQRWYRLKARILGLESLSDYDRSASVATAEGSVDWDEAKETVLDAYSSFSPELADIVHRFFEESWIDAPVRPSKRPGAFCAYTVAGHHPYVLLNWTGRTRDVATLAHELGHGVHAYLSRPQGDFHMATPLTLAETASVFGETVTSNRVLGQTTDPNERFALLAATLEDSIATVFRQVAMNRFEDAVHSERRTVGELSVDRFGELWAETQTQMLGDSVEVTDNYRSWWSYIPHFIATPGYVYAYAYGQLLALSVYARYQERGAEFVPSYLELLSAGGSMPPVELGKIVDCDLTDPGFWDAGLDIVAKQLADAEAAAKEAGRV